LPAGRSQLQHRDHIKTVADVAGCCPRPLRDDLIAAGRSGSAERILEIIRKPKVPAAWGLGKGRRGSEK